MNWINHRGTEAQSCSSWYRRAAFRPLQRSIAAVLRKNLALNLRTELKRAEARAPHLCASVSLG